MYYIYIENEQINGCGQAFQTTEGVINCQVSENVFNEFIEDNLKYIYQNGEIIENPNYEEEKQKVLNKLRINEIQSELDDLDAKRIRAICENEIKDSQSGETWLEYYNKEVRTLREELQELQKSI
jgi:hypothetical protein